MFLDSDQIDELDALDFLVERAAERLVRDAGDMQAWMTEDETGILDVAVIHKQERKTVPAERRITLEEALLNELAHNPYLRHLREALVEALTEDKAFRKQALAAIAQQIEEDKTDARR